MRKIVNGLRALLRRRKALPAKGPEDTTEALPGGEATAIVGGEPSASVEPHAAAAEPIPAEPAIPGPSPAEAPASDRPVPADAEAESMPEEPAPPPMADGAEPVPLPAVRTAPDLVFTVIGVPGRPGMDIAFHHIDTDVRGRDRFPDALQPAEVRFGEYVLDVTGHALSFGPPGRTDSHVLVPVRTRKDSSASMPRNALGNALVPFEVRAIERIDRETAACKGRLKRPPVVGIVFRDAAAMPEAAPEAADADGIGASPMDVAGFDVTDDDAAGPTPSEERAREDLAAMGYLLAQQPFAVPVDPVLVDPVPAHGRPEGDGQGQALPATKGAESIPQGRVPGDIPGESPAGDAGWTPEGAYGR